MESKLKLVSFAAFAALVAVVGYLVAQGIVLAANPALLAVQLLAVILMVWARLTFGRRSFHATADPTAGGLVTNGPYAYIRHPIYAAILFFMTATLLDHRSALSLALVIVVALAVIARAFSEERLLRARYPEYDTYARRTKRFVPFLW